MILCIVLSNSWDATVSRVCDFVINFTGLPVLSGRLCSKISAKIKDFLSFFILGFTPRANNMSLLRSFFGDVHRIF